MLKINVIMTISNAFNIQIANKNKYKKKTFLLNEGRIFSVEVVSHILKARSKALHLPARRHTCNGKVR